MKPLTQETHDTSNRSASHDGSPHWVDAGTHAVWGPSCSCVSEDAAKEDIAGLTREARKPALYQEH